MKHDEQGLGLHHREVHGVLPPGPIGIPEGTSLDFRHGGQVAGLQEVADELARLRDEFLQGGAVHHLLGGNGRVAVVDDFVGQVRFVDVEAGEHHDGGTASLPARDATA